MEDSISQITSISDQINQYGFMVVFSSVCLVLVFTFMIIFIKRWDKANSSKNNYELQKKEIENEMIKKRASAEIDQNEKLFNFVIEVQTTQISQMQSITEAIQLLKDELKENKSLIQNTKSDIHDLDNHVNILLEHYDDIYKIMDNTNKYIDKKTTIIIKEISEHNKMLYELLNIIKNKYIEF